ncbi:HET-domain-containing protein [Hypoxylon sp. NC1633]|nr:HET-domain-containing protein [Hypoxylon sp. NC1633]
MISIDSSQSQIRLLEILPGSGLDDIRCSYRIISLDVEVKYQTLSYVWGESKEHKSVVLEGRAVNVTDNLFSALQTIRSLSESEPTILWVDALCINQEDAVEKMEQVHMMRHIYARCTNCFVHFGKASASETGASEEDSPQVARAVWDAIRLVADPTPYSELPPGLATPEAQAQAGQAFQFIDKGPWWSRIWTIQEGVAPPHHTLLWGPLSMPWEVFVQFSNNAMDLRWPDNLGLNFFSFFPGGVASDLSASFTALEMAASWANDRPDPLEMLWRFRYRNSSDPRDKVYTILALLREGERPLPSVTSSDYEISAATLFKRVTIDLIRDDWGLRPLIGFRGEQKSVPDLPTWAIDWSLPKQNSVSDFWAHNEFYLDFTADRGLPMLDRDLLVSDDDNSTIHLNGVKFDHILASSKPIETSEIDEVAEVWDEITRAAEARGLRQDAAAKTFRKIVFRNMMDGKFLEAGRDSEWRKGMWSNQTLFITGAGYIGLGPSTVAQGDEVWILSGGRVPFLLRPREMRPEHDHAGGLSDYVFVGDTYMPGLMHGEAVEGRLDEQRLVLVH